RASEPNSLRSWSSLMTLAVICLISSRWTSKLVFAELVSRPSTIPEMVAIRAQPRRTASLAKLSRWCSGSERRSNAPNRTPPTRTAKTISDVVSGLKSGNLPRYSLQQSLHPGGRRIHGHQHFAPAHLAGPRHDRCNRHRAGDLSDHPDARAGTNAITS